VPLNVLAIAELDMPWEAVSDRLAGALRPGEWLSAVPYPGQIHAQGTIAIEPAAPISVSLREGLLLVHASTGAWGPGYHERVVAALDALTPALPDGWRRVEDTTQFWTRRDRASLERTFVDWAHTVWSEDQLLALAARRQSSALCLARGEGPVEVPEGRIATPTGFKTRAWVEGTRQALSQALRQAELPRRAREAFLWWSRVPDALDWTQLGRATCTCDVIWRPLVGSDHDEDAPEQVFSRERAVWCFESALRLDPEAAVPLAELERLYALLGREPQPEARRALEERGRAPFEGGYREGWIRRSLGNGPWNVQLPGWLRSSCDDADGHDVFWDEGMTVHVTASRRRSERFSPQEQADEHLAFFPHEVRGRARVEYLADGGLRGYVVTVSGGPGLPGIDTLVLGQVGRARERLTFTVVSRSPEASAMALRLGRSVRALA
jgi:hypothetical protein